MRAKKSFGQHFLHDKHVIQDIIDAVAIDDGELIVEVGPGQGALTTPLSQTGLALILVEADRDLFETLQAQYPQAELVQGDAATVDFDAFTHDRPWLFVSNLPYNAGNAIVMNVLTAQNPPKQLVIMVQREVADRMQASPGEMSLLSVAVQLYTTLKRVRNVASGAFSPPPNVESTVLALTVEKTCDDPEAVLRIARAGFAARRKQLRGNLAKAGVAQKEFVTTWLQEQGLSPTIRAQELTINQWIALTAALTKASPSTT